MPRPKRTEPEPKRDYKSRNLQLVSVYLGRDDEKQTRLAALRLIVERLHLQSVSHLVRALADGELVVTYPPSSPHSAYFPPVSEYPAPDKNGGYDSEEARNGKTK